MELLQRNGYQLRAPEPEDLGVMMQFENTPSLWEVSTPTGPYSRFYLKQYIETNKNDLYEDGQLRLIIESLEKGVIGIIDLFNFEPFHSRAEVGIVIGEAHRRQGIGKLALQILQEHCFDYLGIHQLYAHIDITNEASLRLFKKCGFQENGCLREWMRIGKTYRDVIVMQCINS